MPRHIESCQRHAADTPPSYDTLPVAAMLSHTHSHCLLLRRLAGHRAAEAIAEYAGVTFFSSPLLRCLAIDIYATPAARCGARAPPRRHIYAIRLRHATPCHILLILITPLRYGCAFSSSRHDTTLDTLLLLLPPISFTPRCHTPMPLMLRH